MKRIDVVYGGEIYSVGGRDFAELQQEIAEGVHRPGGHWLKVNDGEGQPRPTYLFLTPGVSIGVVPIPGEE